MADINCQACADLQNDAPGLIVNGITETECTSLGNDTGLNPSSGNNDCTDLNNMNDCLIGNLEPEIEAYDVCEWKEFTKNFVNNTWTVFKGIICAIGGLWTRVHILENEIRPMPKDFIFADVSQTKTVQPGYPADHSNRFDIPCNRTDGYIPLGIVGWNLSNAGTSTGVSNIYVFKVKLMKDGATDYVSIQCTNTSDSNKEVVAEATVLYVKI